MTSKRHKILITGSGRGLGKALSEKFESEGHGIMIHSGRQDANLTNMKELFDLSRRAEEYGVDVLINNAAIICPSITFEKYTIEQIETMIGVNLTAPIVLSRMLINTLEHIVNINSMVGLEVKDPRTLYSATKWGLRGFSNSLKKEKPDMNILDVYPTNIKTYPDRQNAMELSFVVNQIYNSFIKRDQELILDGRKT
jgi:short-subunit dehydrogenase